MNVFFPAFLAMAMMCFVHGATLAGLIFIILAAIFGRDHRPNGDE